MPPRYCDKRHFSVNSPKSPGNTSCSASPSSSPFPWPSPSASASLSTVSALKATHGFGAIALGPWVAFPDAQTAATDPYAKAHRARAGKLLYGGAEGLMFTADTDNQRRKPLSSGLLLRYLRRDPACPLLDALRGRRRRRACCAPSRPCRRLQCLDGAAPAGQHLRHPCLAEAQPDNWLAISRGGRFRLVLTLLDTPTAGSSGVIDLAMPNITRTGCADA